VTVSIPKTSNKRERDMRILLIGTGYVGENILSSWERENDSFTAITTTESKLKKINSYKSTQEALLLKINQDSDLSELIEDFDALIITIAPTKKASFEETYLETSQVITNAIKERKKPLYLLYTSSTSVYGDQEGKITDERALRKPASENAKILCEAEDRYLSASSKYNDVCVLRLGGIYGPNRTLDSRALKMSKKEFPGNGNEFTNNIHLNDITKAIEYCLSKKITGTFNLVNNAHPPRKDLYDYLCDQLEVSPPIWKDSTEGSNAFVSNSNIKDEGFILQNNQLF
jgi:nucleoside-diphosphate-sugar epimerase